MYANRVAVRLGRKGCALLIGEHSLDVEAANRVDVRLRRKNAHRH